MLKLPKGATVLGIREDYLALSQHRKATANAYQTVLSD
jgi:hypothetical protein